MKNIKKLSKTILIILTLLIVNLSLITTYVQAVNIETKNLYKIDHCENVLMYKGIARGATYVVYNQNGIEYPAYCINPEREGVGEVGAYNVNAQEYITDVFLWRIITNGYPYKTIEELGTATKKEAYLATKQAIYCYLDNRDINEFSPIGESGERTLNALKQIWFNAQNSQETKISNIVDIIPIDTDWKQDDINAEYISKTYKIEAPAPIEDYEIEIKGQNLPQGLIVTDKNNNIRNVFTPKEQFKILIPINQLKNGNFEINVKTIMNTKPVLYGASPSEQLQNYALTAFSYEDSTGIYYEEYKENESEIKILKQEKDTKIPLKGVEFQLLNANKQIILQSLFTNEKGETSIKNIEPGTYYLKETKTLPGYILYDEEIQIDIELNEQINIIVNNAKEKKVETTKVVNNIEVENKLEKLPKTGM